MKDLLAGEQQAAVTVAVEALMDAKPEAESFATFDPKVCLQAMKAPPSCGCIPQPSSLLMSVKPDRGLCYLRLQGDRGFAGHKD